MHKTLKLIALLLVSFLNISCSKANKEVTMSEPPSAPEKLADKSTEETSAEPLKLEAGMDISKEIADIKVKTLKNKTKDLNELLGPDKTIFIVVKPGCIFCESFIAVLNSSNAEIKPKQIFVMDKAHAEFDAFKKKADTAKSIDAEWVYDINNAFHDRLGAKSFPRLILVDSQGTVVEHQVGLVVPEDQKQLEGKPMPEVLQVLSLETIKWMKTL